MRELQSADLVSAIRSVLGAALLCGASSSALADQAEPPPPSTTPREATPFGEVVVTAQRREQNIQDVGIAVTPLSESALQDLNITTRPTS